MKISLGYILGNDESSFKELFNLYYPPLCLFARRYIRDEASCEDIVQEAFAKIWTNREKIAITGSVRNYLVSVVRNLCVDKLRSDLADRKYRNAYLDSLPHGSEQTPDEILTISELEALLDKTLRKLPETYRAVFEMNRFEGRTYEEISRILNISVRSAKRYKAYAENSLKEEIKRSVK